MNETILSVQPRDSGTWVERLGCSSVFLSPSGTRLARRSRGGKAGLLLLGLLLLVALGIAVYFWQSQDNREDGISLDYYQTALQAVAATEEAQFERATKLWQELIAAEPDNTTYKLNQAITILSWIEEVNGQLNSGRMEPERRQTLEQELDLAYARIESAVKILQEAETDDFRTTFVVASLLVKKAEESADGGVALRKQAADAIAARLSEAPESMSPYGQLLLAVKFDELASALEPEHPELQQPNADFLMAAFARQPRNMFLLKRAAEVLIANQDPRVKELLKPSVELAGPMMSAPEVARIVERLQPESLIERVAEAVDAGNWPQVRRFQGWLNTTLSMSGFRSDSRIARPTNALALLDTSFLAPLAKRVEQTLPPVVNPLPRYRVQELPLRVQAAAWYDMNADLRFDVAAVSGTELVLLPLDGETLSDAATQRIELGIEATGILPLDLFEVDFPNRPMLPSSVQELMVSQESVTQPNTAAPLAPNRHNTWQQIVLWGEAGIRIVDKQIDGEGFYVVTEPTGLESLTQVQQVVPFDIESDGDLDLLVIANSTAHIMLNRGNRSFEEISQYSVLPASIGRAVSVDLDRDTDQDVVWVDPAISQVGWLENILHSQFRSTELAGEQWKAASQANDVAIADIDGNGSWDIVSIGPSQTAISFTTTLVDQTLQPRYRVESELAGVCVEVADLNNDGALEILAGGADGIWVLAGRYDSGGERGLDATPQSLVLAGRSVTQVSAIDADMDGAIELLAVADGQLVMCQPDELQGNYALVRVRGINDDTGGGRVNHFGLGTVLELWAEGELFARVVKHPATHIGLGTRQPDNLRIIFPNGLTQNDEDVGPNVLVEEIQIQRGSCPYAYGWNGERFELITDLLWNAPLGLQIARGKSLPDRRWENLLLPGHLMQPRDGKIDLRITEELWEFAYFDHIQLTAIDHPADVRVFTNEKVGPPELAEHRIYAVREQLRPVAARDSHGRDITAAIAELDGQFVQAFDRLICQGRVEPHFIELDFGTLPTDEHELVLFLTGWLYPTDTSLNIGIDQNPERSLPEPPSLWVVDETGNWVCAQPFIGFPGGKTKSIAVSLNGVFRSQDHRVRIAGSQQLYWDEAIVGWHAGDKFVREQPLEIESAELRYRGFSRFLPRRPDHPHWFDYHQVSTAPQWPALEGPFTRYGSVLDLVREDDDRMVVMVSGDEIALEFPLPVEPLPADWSRDFVLHSTGWDKDADLNTVAGQGSLPLPFMDQTAYPATLEQVDLANEVWLKNADTLTRQRSHPSLRLKAVNAPQN